MMRQTYLLKATNLSSIGSLSCKWKQPFAAWQVSPSDFVQQPVASESTLCRLEGRMTTYSMHDRDSSLILDERGDRLALIQITARFSFPFLNLPQTLLPILTATPPFFVQQTPFSHNPP